MTFCHVVTAVPISDSDVKWQLIGRRLSPVVEGAVLFQIGRAHV